ncbi:hypothetical protein ONK29_26985, partial [Salmonella enterica subsp. enterica serovar Anatum]|nr:hypothetical protein [Salmonella enterica subsp. enterica serovar Anatum]
DDGVYVSLSIPWGNNRTLSYNGSFSDDNNSNQVGYYERIDDRAGRLKTASRNRGLISPKGVVLVALPTLIGQHTPSVLSDGGY